jgi:GNAT superfamily N-acetyltransferase
MAIPYGIDNPLEMTSVNLEIRPAAPSELPTVLSIIDEAGAWLHSIGITQQWPASFTTSPEWVAFYESFIAQGKVFLARIDGRPVGSYILDGPPHRESTKRVWPDGSDGALILYKLALRRECAGRGVATEMLNWALGYARSLGLPELRLDCYGGNERLKRYYVDAGFSQIADIEFTETDLGSGRTYLVSRFVRSA